MKKLCLKKIIVINLFVILFLVLGFLFYKHLFKDDNLNTNKPETNNQTQTELKANIIITHGMCESSLEYQRFAQDLKNAGFNPILYDIKGHGNNQNGMTGDVNKFEDYAHDLERQINNISNDLPIYLFGHSMGGLINNYFTIVYPKTTTKKIVGVINSAAPTTFFSHITDITQLEDKLKDLPNERISIGGEPNYDISKEARKNQIPYITKNLLKEIFKSILEINKKMKEKSYSYPYKILLIHGEEDENVPFQDSEDFEQLINNKTLTTLIPFEQAPHNLLNDYDSKNQFKVTKTIIEWLNNGNIH
jgi:alpha-beta hydrolase superfamily lysophospholipase